MPDALTRLREADPAAHADPAPPQALLQAILAAPPERPRRRRRAPRIVLAGATLAAAAVVAVAALPGAERAPAPIRHSLVERAIAATAPKPDFITYTVTTTVQTGQPELQSRDTLEQWQYRDRMHNIMGTVQPRGTWRYEHDQQGGTFRTLMHNDKGGSEYQITRRTDPGWDPEELDQGFKAGVTTLVDRFRAQIAKAQDLGTTTFNGRPAHAYRGAADAKERVLGATTYYVDPETALPLGSRMTFSGIEIVTTVDRYAQLAPTPENLAKLDAPALDAAAAREKR